MESNKDMGNSVIYSIKGTTVEPGYNEPPSNEDPEMTKDIFQPSNSKMYEKEPR